MKLLLVEDSPEPFKILERKFTEANLTVFAAVQSDECIDLACRYDYDIIILDLHSPNATGHKLLKKIRHASITTPVLILSSCGHVQKRVKGLELGADDYVTKPISAAELLARIRAIVRRSRGQAPSVVTIGKLTVNLLLRMVQVGKEIVDLTEKEFQILELFCMRRGMIVTKDSILDNLYAGLGEPSAESVKVYIYRLRRKLARANSGEHPIETVRGIGYILRDIY